jgi:predicted acyl esterase
VLFAVLFARTFAERGFKALDQGCCGTSGSGALFAFRDEQRDGLDTLHPLKGQPWLTGAWATAGAG